MIPLFKVYMPNHLENQVSEILNSGQLAYGKYTQEFEGKLRKFVGNSNILTVSGNSVHFALKLIDIKPDDEVIASPMACLATNQPIVYSGANVVWTDIDPLTASLDPDDIKKKITSKTKAIIHYHWAGYPGYIDEINRIAKEHGIYVIEDASESFGAEYKGEKLGNNGTDIVCYSFTPVRIPNAIDGGGLSIRNNDLFQKALLMRDYGIQRANFRDELGEISPDCDIYMAADGCTMNNFNGYVGSQQMEHIADLYSKQRRNAELWNEKLSLHDNVTFMRNRTEINPSYWAYTFLTDKRDALLEVYRQKGYYASKMHLRNDLYSVFRNANGVKLLGVDKFANNQLNLPCGWWYKR